MVCRISLLWVALVVMVVVGPAHSEEPREAARWGFGLLLEGEWAFHDVRTTSRIQVNPPPFFPFFLFEIPARAEERSSPRSGGFSAGVGARAWLPARVLGAQPWVQLGWRHRVGGSGAVEVGASVFDQVNQLGFPVGAFAATRATRIRLERDEIATLKVGLDYHWSALGRRLSFGPVVGWERSRWKFLAQSEGGFTFPGRNLFSVLLAEESSDRWIDGFLAGLELRLPLVEDSAVRVELVVGLEYVRGLEGRMTIEAPMVVSELFGNVAETDVEIDDAVRSSFGLLFRF